MSATINDSNKGNSWGFIIWVATIAQGTQLISAVALLASVENGPGKSCRVLMVFSLVKYGLLKRSRNFKWYPNVSLFYQGKGNWTIFANPDILFYLLERIFELIQLDVESFHLW